MSSALAQSADASRAQRRIALVRPADPSGEDTAAHAIQLFDSVLWVFKGTTQCNWAVAPPEQADVIVVHQAEPASNLDRWRRAGKLIVVVSTDRAFESDQPRLLRYPFPAAQVLSLLEQLEIELDGGAPSHPAVQAVAAVKEAGGDPWSFVETLRILRSASNPDLWLMGKTSGRSLWIRGDGACYACDDATAAALCGGELSLHALVPHKSKAPPAAFGLRSGSELAWWATYHAATTPAPWLTAGARYQLRRWPDFGRLRTRSAELRAAQLRVVAALDAAPLRLEQLATRANVSPAQAVRMCNALAADGFVTAMTTVVEPVRVRHVTPEPAGGLQRFLRSLRSYLRIGADA